MLARALLFALVATAVWVAIEHVISTYGALILSALCAAATLYLFGRYVGPKLPVYLGGDPKPPPPVDSDLEWELYLAIVSCDLAEAKSCLSRGADPFASFSPSRRPATTDAASCYDFARQGRGRGEFADLFEQHRSAPNNLLKPKPLRGSG